MAQPTEEQLKLLIELYQSGKLDEAESQAHALLKQFPDNLTCLNILGVVLDAKGKNIISKIKRGDRFFVPLKYLILAKKKRIFFSNKGLQK